MRQTSIAQTLITFTENLFSVHPNRDSPDVVSYFCTALRLAATSISVNHGGDLLTNYYEFSDGSGLWVDNRAQNGPIWYVDSPPAVVMVLILDL